MAPSRQTDVTDQACYKITLGWENSWYWDKDVWNIISPKYCSNMEKTHKIPQEFSLIHVTIAGSHLPRLFLAVLWCLQFPHLFSTLLPEPCACLFLLHFYDVSALAISFALLVLSNNRMSGRLAEVYWPDFYGSGPEHFLRSLLE